MSAAGQVRSRPSATDLLDGAVAALSGPNRHAAVILALTIYSAIWTAYRLVSTMPRDIHFDMSELYAWSLVPAFGYDKHPPLSALIVHLWFAVFPVDDWSFTLLAMLNIALTLYIAWRIFERWTDPLKAIFGLALLMLIPFYNFQALKYNANTVLLPVWAFTAYAFFRAVETRSASWGAVAGAAAGAAMLGKYWSIFLVVGLVLAALIDRRRRGFFQSPAPYMMIVAGSLVLAPHIYWVLSSSADTLTYAARRLGEHEEFSLGAALFFTAGIVGYSGLALILWGVLARPSLQALRDTAWPGDPQRRLALLCFLLPNLLPMVPARWTGFQLTPLWTLPGYSLLPLVLLASPKVRIDRVAARRVVGIAATVSLGALILSPLVALALHVSTDARPNDYASLLSQDVTLRWNEMSQRPLATVFSCGNAPDVAIAVAYDLRLPSRMLYGKQGLGARADILGRGGAIVGAADDADCSQQGEAIAAMRPGSERFAFTYRPTLFGIAGRPFSYTAYIIPPP